MPGQEATKTETKMRRGRKPSTKPAAQRKAERLVANRFAAQKCRLKKKLLIDELQCEVNRLRDRNLKLELDNQRIAAMIQYLKSPVPASIPHQTMPVMTSSSMVGQNYHGVPHQTVSNGPDMSHFDAAAAILSMQGAHAVSSFYHGHRVVPQVVHDEESLTESDQNYYQR